jgi:hypothetical protein
MSRKSFLEFLVAARDSPAMLARYDQRNLPQMLFHARNDGYDFTVDEVSAVIGSLEESVIVHKDDDPFDGTSRLWRHMWGRRHLAYVIDSVLCRHTDAELAALADHGTIRETP